MASTNIFLTLVSTVQTNNIGSTISTGYIPYVSTSGRLAYANTLSTLTISTLLTNTLIYPSNTSNPATTAYVSSATGSLLSTTNTWTANNAFNGPVYVPTYGDLTSTISSLSARLTVLETTTMKQGVLSYMTGHVTVSGRNDYVGYYLSDAYYPRADGAGAWYGNRWYFTQ